MAPIYGSAQASYGGSPWGSYFLPGYNYSTPGQDMSGSGIADYLQRQNWQIAYDYWSKGAGLSPNGLFAQFARSQEPLMQRAFNASLVTNPDMTPQNFLNQYGQNLQNVWGSLPYQLRGENPSSWGQGRTQWVRRNN